MKRITTVEGQRRKSKAITKARGHQGNGQSTTTLTKKISGMLLEPKIKMEKDAEENHDR